MTRIRAISQAAAKSTAEALARDHVTDYGYHASPSGYKWFVYIY